tara:strand:+ start:1664 stop:2614 length:951 start_codon:yes stop_codon:yes gene_type:complete
MYRFLFIFILITFLIPKSFAEDDQLRFIVVGHLYPIVNNDKEFMKFVKKVNSYDPDYLFILGDSQIQNKEIYIKLLKLFKTKIYFSPGNHELKKSKKDYISNVGYLNLTIEKKKAKFILLNSSENLKNIKHFLKKSLEKEFNNGPTIIFTHHRIWDDTVISENEYEHDKSFYFDEIYPIIKNKVQYIFSGNSKRQYFRDYKDSATYGKQNVNNIFWLDKIGSINAYSIGIGDGIPKANFTIVDIINGKVIVNGDFSTSQSNDIIPREKISMDKHKLSNKYSKKNYFFINKNKFIKVLGLLITLLLIFLYIRKILKK